jgi:predicted GNAT family N-acyltransferase
MPLAVPAALRELLDAFEAGQGMLDVRTGTWDTLGREAAALRRAVFGHEQGISPCRMDGDAGDAQALHAVAYNRLGMPLGTGRLLEAGDGASRVGRMAVRADLRGSGIGRALLQALEGAARQRGDRSVVLDAQAGVEGFYTRTGYAATGRRFDAAGIAHVEMSRRLGA